MGNSKELAFNLTSRGFKYFGKVHKITKKELKYFERICSSNFPTTARVEIQSSGYVIHTLEAAVWCLMNADNYSETVLKAVNLGDDTDTTAAVAGGLAGLLYGFGNIPSEWVGLLARKNDILDLAKRYCEKICEIEVISNIIIPFKNPFVVPLTDEEIESLKKSTAEAKKYFREKFQNEKSSK